MAGGAGFGVCWVGFTFCRWNLYLRVHVVKPTFWNFLLAEGVTMGLHHSSAPLGPPFKASEGVTLSSHFCKGPRACVECHSARIHSTWCQWGLACQEIQASSIHSASLVGRNCRTGWSLLFAYLSHTWSCAPERSIASVATAEILYYFFSYNGTLLLIRFDHF